MNKIFFFDIDGTLAIQKQIPENNLKVLAELKKQGYLTFICSGRNPRYAQSLFQNIVSGYITCNGRYILYQGEPLHREKLTKEEISYYKEKIDNTGCGCLFLSDQQFFPYHLHDQQIEMMQKEYGSSTIVNQEDNLDFYNFDLFYQTLTQRDQMIKVFENDLVINDHGGRGHADCSIIGFDKGNAISYLLNHFDIAKENAYAFGDGYNDQAMFRETGHRIAMGNAVAVLKEKATYITDAVDQDGIYKALVHEGILSNINL